MYVQTDWREAANDVLLMEAELRARRAERDVYFWLTECTKTKDEQDSVNPFKPFPKKDYIRHLLDPLCDDDEIRVNIIKSRTMMASWTVSGYCAHRGFTRPATTVVFQSQDEDRAVHDLEYVKILWENSEPLLRERWPLKKAIDKQPYNYFELANHSKFIAIPGDPQKIRSEHPTIVVLEEAAHIEQGEESYNVAVATRCRKLIGVSSADKGYYDDMYQKTRPVDWPERYMRERNLHANATSTA